MAVMGDPWDETRLGALAGTFKAVLQGNWDPDSLSPDMRVSVDFLRPMWDYATDSAARSELVRLFVDGYKFPHKRALYAALADLDISIDAFREVSPDGLGASVQLLVEGGYPGEAYSLMRKRCQTRTSKGYNLDKYFDHMEADNRVDSDLDFL